MVDDEKIIRDGCRRVLAGKGYDVLTAEDGQTALAMIGREPLDTVLLDLKMPKMDGERVLEIMRAQNPDIPVIIITGHGTIDTAVECMKNGAYDFITKPFQVDQFLLTVERATEKRRLEQRAKRLQEENIKNLYDLNLEKSRLKAIINCMANGVVVTNRNLEVVLHNPIAMELLEVNEAVRLPFPVDRLIEGDALVGALKKILEDQSSSEARIAQEVKAGKNALRAISAPAFDQEGHVVGTVTVLENITAFKQLDQMKSDFVNMVAHELRSPLVAIKQIDSVMLDGLAGTMEDKQQELVKRGAKKIDALLELINDLLDVAKLEEGKYVRQQIPIDLDGIIKEIVALMEPKAHKQGIEIAYSSRNLRPVQADPKNMEEVFGNLITNAVNYSPDGGKVTISAEGMGSYAEIEVSDTGVGIPPEEQPKIFDRFYRVKHPRTREVIGTGLGLSIVKGIIEAHHGTIDVESVPDQGTTFRIRLPFVP